MNETISQKNWWQRNWKWATGGCLGLVIIFVISIGYGIYKIGNELSEETSLFTFLKVIQTVQKSPDVIEALGKPIEFEKDATYNPETQNEHLALEMELIGPKDSGTVSVVANKVIDDWEYEIFTVTIKSTGEVIDLRNSVN